MLHFKRKKKNKMIIYEMKGTESVSFHSKHAKSVHFYDVIHLFHFIIFSLIIFKVYGYLSLPFLGK